MASAPTRYDGLRNYSKLLKAEDFCSFKLESVRTRRAAEESTGRIAPVSFAHGSRQKTGFFHLRTPAKFSSRFGDSVVIWLGGWTRDRLSGIVMVAKFDGPSSETRRKRRPIR
jgi:hypothetical protein